MSRILIRLLPALATTALCAHLLPPRGGVDGWSLFPPLVAIVVAIATGRLILGLSLAILGGAVLSLAADTPLYMLPLAALERSLFEFIWKPLADSFQLFILGFTAALIGMVRVISLAGGTQGIADLLVRRAAGARSTRLATVLMGLAIFFDDYANTLVVGTTMRPITDRFRISREKLAYLVDSTAAPVAGLAVISTWIGYEVGLFDDVMRQVGAGISGYELFFRALPVRFYCLFALFFVLLSTIMQRDFGPMLTAERRAWREGQPLAPGAHPLTGQAGRETRPHPDIRGHWLTAAAPVLLVIFGVLGGMHMDSWNAETVVAARQQHPFFSRTYWTLVFSEANSSRVMFISSIAGSLLAFVIALTRRGIDGRRPLSLWQICKTWTEGITGFYYALLILILAWAIKETCTAVHTSTYLIGLLSGLLEPNFLPVLVFLLAALVAFSIGTSWTTMAILLPTMVPVAFDMGQLPLAVLVAAAVLDGAIFGDHCSPISDTTVLSSIASSCDHLAHVKTQMPYALATMLVAAVFGYVGTTLLYPSYVGLLLGFVVLILLLRLIGKSPE
jgi:Na+/H+ antiporter NhaC